jgi:hypothetical protein
MLYPEQVTYERNVLCIQRDLQYGDFGNQPTLKVESSSFLMMTSLSISLSQH